MSKKITCCSEVLKQIVNKTLTKIHKSAAWGSSWWSISVELAIRPSHASLSPPPQKPTELKQFMTLEFSFKVISVIKNFLLEGYLPMMLSLKIWLILGFVDTWQSKLPASDALVNFSFSVFCPRLGVEEGQYELFPIPQLIQSRQSTTTCTFFSHDRLQVTQ